MGYEYATGFERGNLSDEGALSIVSGSGNALNYNTSNEHSGSGCLEVVTTSNVGRTAWAILSSSAMATALGGGPTFIMSSPKPGVGDPPPNTLYAGSFWFRANANVSGATSLEIFSGFSPSAANEEIRIGSAGQVYIAIEGSPPGTQIGTFTIGQWHLIEFIFRRDNSSWRAQARMDGGTTQQITSPTLLEGIGGFGFGRWASGSSATYGTIQFDDFVVTTQASPSMIGDHRVAYISMDSGASDLDTNWSITGGDATRNAAIARNPLDTTKYIASSTSGQTQRTEFAAFPSGIASAIKCIDVRGEMKETASNTGTVTVNLQSSAGTDGSTVNWSYPATGTFNDYPRQTNAHIVVDVPGGTGLTEADVNGMRFKVTKDANTRTIQVCSAAMYVAYTPAAPPPPLDHQFPSGIYKRRLNAGWV